MAMRNALMPFQLPEAASVTALTNPLMQGMQTYRQGMAQEFEGNRALERERLARKADSRADEDQSMQREARLTQRMGALAQVIADDPNPTTAAANWSKLHQSMPQLKDRMMQYGVNPNDYKAGASFLAAEAGKYQSPLQREREQLQNQVLRKQANAPVDDGSKIVEVGGQLVRVPRQGQAQVVFGSDPVAQRRQQVIDSGLDPEQAENKVYIATGKRPRDDQKDLTASDRKVIIEAENELPTLAATKQAIQRAIDLNDKIYSGYLSGARSTWNQAAPGILPNVISNPQTSANTQEFAQLTNLEAIKLMSQTLKGATTDREMAQFQQILANPNTSAEVRKRTLQRMLAISDAAEQTARARISDMRGGGYFKPTYQQPTGQTAPQAQQQQTPANDPLGIRSAPSQTQQPTPQQGTATPAPPVQRMTVVRPTPSEMQSLSAWRTINVGDVKSSGGGMGRYKYLGGPVSDPNNWELVQ